MGQNSSSAGGKSPSGLGDVPSGPRRIPRAHSARRAIPGGRRHSVHDEKSPSMGSGDHRFAPTASRMGSAARHANDRASASPEPAPSGKNLDSPVPVSCANNIGAPPAYVPMHSPPATIPEFEAPPRTDVPISPSAENALELLREYDTVFLVDDSGSMAGESWNETGQALAWVAQAASQYDDDGIDIYFLNSREHADGVRSANEVRTLFARVTPSGHTPTGARLDHILRSYLANIEQAQRDCYSYDPRVTRIKPVNYIVITDGAPTDDPESVIVAAARRLDNGQFPLCQVGIQFVQIGNYPEATKALEELDDDLSGRYGIRDIVDTTPYTSRLDGETLIKILLGGINKRVDRRGGAAVLR